MNMTIDRFKELVGKNFDVDPERILEDLKKLRITSTVDGELELTKKGQIVADHMVQQDEFMQIYMFQCLWRLLQNNRNHPDAPNTDRGRAEKIGKIFKEDLDINIFRTIEANPEFFQGLMISRIINKIDVEKYDP